MSALLPALSTALSDLWQQREPRERLLISIAAMVVVCGAIFALILDPAWQGQVRLKTALPAAQTKTLQVQQLAAQLGSKGDVPARNTALNQSSIQAALSSAGINANVSASAPWVVKVNSASGDALWGWLNNHTVSASQFKRLPSGAWQGDMTLAP